MKLTKLASTQIDYDHEAICTNSKLDIIVLAIGIAGVLIRALK